MPTQSITQLLERARQLIHYEQKCEAVDHQECVFEWQKSVCDALESLHAKMQPSWNENQIVPLKTVPLTGQKSRKRNRRSTRATPIADSPCPTCNSFPRRMSCPYKCDDY
jgi:hypothetical protein